MALSVDGTISAKHDFNCFFLLKYHLIHCPYGEVARVNGNYWKCLKPLEMSHDK